MISLLVATQLLDLKVYYGIISWICVGLVGLAISYALGITGKLSGLVSSFTETEKELVAVERCVQYIDNIPSEKLKGNLKLS